MTIYRLNFLLKVAHILVCQNPSFISTTFFQPNSAQKHDFRFKMISPSFSPKINEFHQKKNSAPSDVNSPTLAKSGANEFLS